MVKRKIMRLAIDIKVVGLHLLATMLMAAGLAVVVFVYWFPPGLRELAGGTTLFGLLVAGLLVSGPFVTALLYRTTKSRLALRVDVAFTGLLQVLSLLYGLNAIVQARPLALVFETDRFRLITYADIPLQALPPLTEWISPWSLDGLIMASIRGPSSAEERAQRFDDMLVDISPSQRPIYWQDIEYSTAHIRGRARLLSDLRAAYPSQQKAIDQAVEQDSARTVGKIANGERLMWLPLVSRHNLEWVVILDPLTVQIIAFLPLDGFI
jgi:hypothetical protein